MKCVMLISTKCKQTGHVFAQDCRKMSLISSKMLEFKIYDQFNFVCMLVMHEIKVLTPLGQFSIPQ